MNNFPEMSKKSRGFMDLDSDDDDFEPKAKPGTKSKRRAGDSDEDFAPAKLKKKKRKDEVLKTSTQGKVDSAIATGTQMLRTFAITRFWPAEPSTLI